MDGVACDEARKRRLPLWMVAGADTDKATESNNVDRVNNDDVKKGGRVVSQRGQPKSKAGMAAISVPCDKEDMEVEASMFVNCKKKRRRGRTKSDEADCDGGNVIKPGFEKQNRGRVGRKAREAAQAKRRKAKSVESESSEEIEAPSASEDDGDFSMEDLMSIAREYVKSDKDTTTQHQLSEREQKSERQLSPPILSTNKSRGSLDAPRTNRSPTPKETASGHTFAENLTTDGMVVNRSMTGDPTQDMLDLFLGPLLKKPHEGENKRDLVRDDITFAYEIRKPSQNVVLGEEPIPVMKKKSSLKDKVAMFLD